MTEQLPEPGPTADTTDEDVELADDQNPEADVDFPNGADDDA